MSDPRVIKLAKVLTHYSLQLKPGDQFVLSTSPLAEELNLAVYEEAVKAGAHIFVQQSVSGASEIFYKNASETQLDYLSPFRKMLYEQADAFLTIDAPHNTRALTGIDPQRFARFSRANAPVTKTFMDRAAKGELRWCYTVYPTQAQAQEAEMSLGDYQDFVYGAGMLNEVDPAAYWQSVGERQQKMVSWLKGHENVVLKGSNIDLTLAIKDRVFISADGKANFPDGEIFTSPVDHSANGWVRFRYPAIEYGQEITDIELWFEGGKVVKEKASKNLELLTGQLNTDAGARFIGELGIGTNYGIQRFTKHMLFDEKMGGTIHLALGASFPEAGGKNESGIHWDMLCDMNDGQIRVDGEVFYQDGKVVTIAGLNHAGSR